MTYTCKICNYSTDRQYCYEKHVETIKHNKKVNEVKNKKATFKAPHRHLTDTSDIHKCQYCNIIYTRASSLTRHMKICPNSVNENRTKQIHDLEEELKKYKELQYQTQKQHQDELNTLKEFHLQLQKQQQDEINHLKTLINNAGAVIKTSVSALSYITQNYHDAPVIRKLKDFSYLQEIDAENSDEEFDLTQLIINHQKDKTIVKYLGNIIVEAYKTEDPSKQSIWSSDSVRLTYIIRELINKKPDWTVDKKGVKTSKYIIAPLLEYISQLMVEFMDNNKLEDHLDDSEWKMKRRMENLQASGEICFNIKNKSLEEQLLKYIAPHFYLVKNDQLIDY